MTDWLLTVLLLVVYPIAFYPIVRLGGRVRKNSRRAQEQARAHGQRDPHLEALLVGLREGRRRKPGELEEADGGQDPARFIAERARPEELGRYLVDVEAVGHPDAAMEGDDAQ